MRNIREKMTTVMLIAIFMISTFAFMANADYLPTDLTVGTQPVDIDVTDDGTHIIWTIDFPGEAPYDDPVTEGNGSFAVGLVIALDGVGEGPTFQVHNNDGTDSSFDWGTWLVSPWGPTIEDGWKGWHSGDTNTLVSELSQVTCTGQRHNGQNPDGLFTISIDKSELGDSFHWALNLAIGGGFYSTYLTYEQMAYPSATPGPSFNWATPIVDDEVQNYEYVQFLDATFRDTEKIWGGDPDLVILPDGDGLTVEVSGRRDYAHFEVTIPECYNPEISYTTFAFDVDSNGLADFQIQYDGTGWVYSEVDLGVKSGWVKDSSVGWLPVPSDMGFTLGHGVGSRVFTLELPIETLGGFESAYKLGVQACRPGGRQIFYSTHPGHLWYDAAEGDYAHSTYYVDMVAPSAPPRPKLWGCPIYYDGISPWEMSYAPHKLIVGRLKTAPHDEGYYPLTVEIFTEDNELTYNRLFYIRPTARSFALYLHGSAFPDNYSVVITCSTGELPYLVCSRAGIERSSR